jgi:hypothetical protein
VNQALGSSMRPVTLVQWLAYHLWVSVVWRLALTQWGCSGLARSRILVGCCFMARFAIVGV